MATPLTVSTRERILDAAANRFFGHGYAQTSLRDIATECDVRPASIYHHFESKDMILREVLSIGIERIASTVRQALNDAGSDFTHRLHRAVTAHLTALFELGAYSACHIVVFPTAPQHVRSAVAGDRDGYEAVWHQLLTDGVAEGALRSDIDIGLARLQLMGAMNATLGWYRAGNRTIEEVADSYTEIFIRGTSRTGAR